MNADTQTQLYTTQNTAHAQATATNITQRAHVTITIAGRNAHIARDDVTRRSRTTTTTTQHYLRRCSVDSRIVQPDLRQR